MKPFDEYFDFENLSLNCYDVGSKFYAEDRHQESLRWLLASALVTKDISGENSTIYLSAVSALACKDLALGLVLLDFLLYNKPDHHAGRQLRICLTAFQEKSHRKLSLPSQEYPAAVNDLIEVLNSSDLLDWESFEISGNEIGPKMLSLLILRRLNAPKEAQ